MPDLLPDDKADVVALATIQQVYECIDTHTSFLLEAGAGAGKTYSLIAALKYLIESKGRQFTRRQQSIACITYTNVAKDEIIARTDKHPAVHANTIHGFCWSTMSNYQGFLRKCAVTIPGLMEKIEECGGLGLRRIEYDLGYRRVTDNLISLGHDDVLKLMVMCLDQEKFRIMLGAQYPVIFIDEYQDTDKNIAQALATHFLGASNQPLVGFFGDHWQKIYGTGCGRIDHPALTRIDKGVNFRSAPPIVELLNKMRPELPQIPKHTTSTGTVTVFHTNTWSGVRQAGTQWKGALPSDVAHDYLNRVTQQLASTGWDLSVGQTKILMLTHNVLSQEQGYAGLYSVFAKQNEDLIKKEDPYIEFLADTLEPAYAAYAGKRYGEMFTILGAFRTQVISHADKIKWTQMMDSLDHLRQNGTVGDVIDYLNTTDLIGLPDRIQDRERRFAEANNSGIGSDEMEAWLSRLPGLKAVQYAEIIEATKFINEQTPFSTKHGVKGAQFENVLVVIGRGWNIYDFDKMLAWSGTMSSLPSDKQDALERNRNLFYVACSRPKSRLALLFTTVLSPEAMATLAEWFGTANIVALTVNN